MTEADCVQVRLASGALVIAVEQDLSVSNVSIIKATFIFLNIGLVPLLASYDSLLSIMYVVPVLSAFRGAEKSHRSRENFPNNKVLRSIHHICAVLIMLATGLLIGAGTLTGNAKKRSLQSALYKIGYFDFLAVFLVAFLINLRASLTQRKRVKYQHLTVSPSVVRISQATKLC
jgi:uncharacterized membrane protein